MKKLIFVDVDGTIYKSHQLEIDQSIKEKLKEASLSCDLYLSTGRCLSVLEPLKEAINYFKGFVLSNGSLVIIDGKAISDNFIPKNDLIKLIDAAKELNSNIALIERNKVYVKEYNEIVDIALKPYKEGSVVSLNSYDFDLTRNYNMAWSFDYAEKIEKLKEKIPQFSFFTWGAIGSDIIIKGITKREGIKKVLEQIDHNEFITYAIGDALNDLEMFELVDVPICMGNGVDELKKHAKHITESIYDNGFENAIDKILKGEW